MAVEDRRKVWCEDKTIIRANVKVLRDSNSYNLSGKRRCTKDRWEIDGLMDDRSMLYRDTEDGRDIMM